MASPTPLIIASANPWNIVRRVAKSASHKSDRSATSVLTTMLGVGSI
jgi:hypothetical protein